MSPEHNSGQVEELIGKLIDEKYRIVEKLGAGGMGAVFRAEHVLMGRDVALKILHPHLAQNEESLRRFRHEAKIASKLRHPHAVMIFDFGVFEGMPYLVMELAQGRTLRDLIKSEGPVAAERLRQIVEQVCSALEQAHTLNIVHRDLKPENIVLSRSPTGEEEFARVLDFGIAKIVQTETPSDTLATQAGMFLGTPRYASPEQATNRPLDGRSDIYTLGIILYEALVGEVPFDAPSTMELLVKHLQQPPPPLRKKVPRLSEALEQVVLRCLEKEPEKRFQRVSEIAVAFNDALHTTSDKTSLRALALGTATVIVLGTVVFFVRREPVPLAPPAAVRAEPTATAVAAVDETQKLEEFAPFGPSFSSESPPPEQPLVTPLVETGPAPTVPSPSLEVTEAPLTTTAAVTVPTASSRSTAALFAQAESLYRQRRYQEAIPIFESALAVDSGRVRARLSLGICYLRVGRRDVAFRQFQMAARAQPNYPPTHFNLACYYALEGDAVRALDELETTIRLEPSARKWAREDEDLRTLRRHPRFLALTR